MSCIMIRERTCSREFICWRRGPFKCCHGDSVCVPVLLCACARESHSADQTFGDCRSQWRITEWVNKQTNTDKTRGVTRRRRFITAELWNAVILKLCCEKRGTEVKWEAFCFKGLFISCKCVWIWFCSYFAFLRDVWMFESVCVKSQVHTGVENHIN